MYPPIDDLQVVYEDAWLLVVNKPSGMLSQPGRFVDGSVLTRVLQSNRSVQGPVLVHRLDMDTSGLLLLAKTRDVHRALQQQFEKRKIKKRYRAILEKPVAGLGGCIRLPIRLDINDRPRQMVCTQHGKVSLTLWHKTDSKSGRGITFYPLTGRSHQLRLHAAATQGLGQAILGDNLYGSAATYPITPLRQENLSATQPVQNNRLMLHADCLQFEHPHRQQALRVVCPAPFIADHGRST